VIFDFDLKSVFGCVILIWIYFIRLPKLLVGLRRTSKMMRADTSVEASGEDH